MIYRVSGHGFFKGRHWEAESSLSLMFLNIIHEETLSEVAAWRSAEAQRKQTFLVVNNGKQTGVDNGNEATLVSEKVVQLTEETVWPPDYSCLGGKGFRLSNKQGKSVQCRAQRTKCIYMWQDNW